MGQPLLEGQAPAQQLDYWEVEARKLRLDNDRIKTQFKQLDEALRLERIRTQTIEAGVMELKGMLSPFYRALQKLWLEFDQMDIVSPSTDAPQFDKKWEAWKQKLGPTTAAARVIQAILDHGPLNRSQLRQATKSGWSTLDEATGRLKNLQLIEKVGDRWNLKS